MRKICTAHNICQLVELEAWAVTGSTWQG